MPVKLEPDKIPVVLLYNVDPGWTKNEQHEVIRQSRHLGGALMDEGHTVFDACVTDDDIASCLSPFNPSECVVFNWCEELPGIGHSEWLVAKKLEQLGFTFTGANAETLALAQDKFQVKKILDDGGIPTPVWSVFHRANDTVWDRFPAIVKPAREHCSAGITRDSVVLDKTELQERVLYILDTYRQPALVEDFIDGREFRVSVWGNKNLTMPPVAEMDFSFFKNIKDRLCTQDAKFHPGSEHYEKIETLLPAPLSAAQTDTLGKICCDSYRALGCRDYARMDVRLKNDIFYVLDVNPNADISHDASMACAAEKAGLSYGGMGSLFVRYAAGRHPLFGKKRSRRKHTAPDSLSLPAAGNNF